MSQNIEDERKLTEKQFDKLYNEGFDTYRLLRAVDALDAIRPIFSDECGAGGGIPRPPEIRDKLLDLHQRAMDLFNSGYRRSTDRGVFDLALEIEDEIFEAIENLETIRDTLSDLTVLTPDEDEVEEGENEDD